ncbi:MAG: hypothetical protein C9356_15675 [Oleiphilus sp.]|nr:MAG: hypothetical protein C9356_15675 [Oleiphilus sp.]
MKTIRTILWSVLITTGIFTLLYVIAGDDKQVVSTINDERVMVAHVMGHDALESAVSNTDYLFGKLKPIYQFTHNMLPDKETEYEQVDSAFLQWCFQWLNLSYNKSHNIFWGMIYQSLQRAMIIFELMPITLLIVLVAAYDGFTVRAINSESFKFASPVIYQYGYVALFACLAVMLALTTIPFALPFWLIATGCLAIAIFIRQIVSHLPPKF